MARHDENMHFFLFEKLPQEIQTMILRAAMPQYGILSPKTRQPRCPDVISERESISTSLFLVSKTISAEVQRIIQQDVFLVIEVTSRRPRLDSISTSYLHTSIDLGYANGFRSLLTLSDIQPLQRMRHFEIAPMIDRSDLWWFTRARWNLGVKPHAFVAERREEYKEKLRLICDTLSAHNDNIQQLVFRMPCLCNLRSSEAALAISHIIECLSPIRRLRTLHPTTFRITHDGFHLDQQPRPIKHDKATSEPFIKALYASFGKLVGEELSTKEKTWKDIKAMERVQNEPAVSVVNGYLFDLWDCLSLSKGVFEAMAMEVKGTMLRLLAEEKGLEGKPK
ncbi:MAG: hypothetical protein L6R42_004166 [Xanthoria sp. 1 TBL-2021]|nr:MAG: hypothetical protein L6R42_004166 [Xanthoria sp. 1 TBL-2021]